MAQTATVEWGVSSGNLQEAKKTAQRIVQTFVQKVQFSTKLALGAPKNRSNDAPPFEAVERQ